MKLNFTTQAFVIGIVGLFGTATDVVSADNHANANLNVVGNIHDKLQQVHHRLRHRGQAKERQRQEVLDNDKVGADFSPPETPTFSPSIATETPTTSPTQTPRTYAAFENDGCGAFESLATTGTVADLRCGFDAFACPENGALDISLSTPFPLFGDTQLTSIRIWADGCIGIGPNNADHPEIWTSNTPIAIGGSTERNSRDQIPRICVAHEDFDPSRFNATDGVLYQDTPGVSFTVSWETDFCCFSSGTADIVQAQIVLYYQTGNFELRWGMVKPDFDIISAGIDYDVDPFPRAVPAVGAFFNADGRSNAGNQSAMPENTCQTFRVVTPLPSYAAFENDGCGAFASLAATGTVARLKNLTGSSDTFDGFLDVSPSTPFPLFGDTDTPLTSLRIWADGCIGIAPINTAPRVSTTRTPIAVGGPTGGLNRDQIPRICVAHGNLSPSDSSSDGVLYQDTPGVSFTVSWETDFCCTADMTDIIQAQIVLFYRTGNFELRWGKVFAPSTDRIEAGIDYDVAPFPRAVPAVGAFFDADGSTRVAGQAGMPENTCQTFRVDPPRPPPPTSSPSTETPTATETPTLTPTKKPFTYAAFENNGCGSFASLAAINGTVALLSSPIDDGFLDVSPSTPFPLFGDTPLTSIRIWADGCIGIAPINTATAIWTFGNLESAAPIAIGGSTAPNFRDQVPRICVAHDDFDPSGVASDGVLYKDTPGVSFTVSWETDFFGDGNTTDIVRAQIVLFYQTGNFELRWGTVIPLLSQDKISAGIDYDVAPFPRAVPAVGAFFGPDGITVNGGQAGMPENTCQTFHVIDPEDDIVDYGNKERIRLRPRL